MWPRRTAVGRGVVSYIAHLSPWEEVMQGRRSGFGARKPSSWAIPSGDPRPVLMDEESLIHAPPKSSQCSPNRSSSLSI
jgi:hypothetical protein